MKTRAVPHHAWMHVAAQTWLTVVITLTLALWYPAEADTSYSFIGFDAPLPGVVSTTITGVDYKSGQLVGEYTDVHGNRHGWRGNRNVATMVPLLPISGVNRRKWTVGSFVAPGGGRHGFLLKGTELIPITVPGCVDVYANAVNEAGEVVGDCGWLGPVWHWKDGAVTVIPPPDEGGGCEQFGFTARGIDTTGVIVGACADGGYTFHHGVYTMFNGDTRTPFQVLKNGVMSFVAYPGAQGTVVTAVHPTNGRIWGDWWGSDGLSHAFTATPTPGMAAR
jgi:hypothetical protein